MKPLVYLLLVILIGILSCNKNQSVEADLMVLFQKEKELNCRLASMKDSITAEWDNITSLLNQNLPTDMPEAEKANMLKVRNANLIRMFQSFDNVDETIKSALQRTEEMDMKMTKRITSAKRESNNIESQKLTLFEQANNKFGVKEVTRLKSINEKLQTEHCK